MSTYELTPARRAWLHKLKNEGVAKRAKSRTGYDCMRAGWTEWNFVPLSGAEENLTHAEAKARFGDKYWDFVGISGERLTPLGKKVLADEG
jgi:hypothetical protein